MAKSTQAFMAVPFVKDIGKNDATYASSQPCKTFMSQGEMIRRYKGLDFF